MKKFVRGLLLILIILLIGMLLMGVRYYFDQRDRQAACDLVMRYQPAAESPETLGQIMETINQIPPGFMHCQARVVSRYEKKLSVECRSAYVWNWAYSFLWSVDLVSRSVVPDGRTTTDLLTRHFEEQGNDQQPKF